MDFCRELRGDTEYLARIYGGNTPSKIGLTVYKCKRISMKRIKSFMPPHSRFIYFSFDARTASYQLAWWSGETTWVDSAEDRKYYETAEDLLHQSWYVLKDQYNPYLLPVIRLYGE